MVVHPHKQNNNIHDTISQKLCFGKKKHRKYIALKFQLKKKKFKRRQNKIEN